MKHFLVIALFAALLSGLSSCYSTSIKKPDKLIKKDKFEKILVDIYLIQGMNTSVNNPKALKNVTQTDLYYSVLNKYEVADSVFIRSLIYYSSFPKDYEKMHVKIMDNLKESELQFKPKDKLETGEK